ncbi:MAG: ERCC4 domain-containing protein [archaeon]
MSEEIKIIVDTREQEGKKRSSDVFDVLKKMDCKIEKETLNAGDYILSDRIAVEVKASISDFCSSLQEGRLFDQVKRLSNSEYDQPALLISGALFYKDNQGKSYTLKSYYDKKSQKYKKTKKRLHRHPNSIRGALNSIRFDYNVNIIGKGVSNPYAAAKELYNLAKREQKDKDRAVKIQKAKKKKMSKSELQRLIIESLPKIGPKMAEKLLNKKETPKNIINLKKEELMDIEGIGKKTAEDILEIINKEYNSIKD